MSIPQGKGRWGSRSKVESGHYDLEGEYGVVYPEQVEELTMKVGGATNSVILRHSRRVGEVGERMLEMCEMR